MRSATERRRAPWEFTSLRQGSGVVREVEATAWPVLREMGAGGGWQLFSARLNKQNRKRMAPSAFSDAGRLLERLDQALTECARTRVPGRHAGVGPAAAPRIERGDHSRDSERESVTGAVGSAPRSADQPSQRKTPGNNRDRDHKFPLVGKICLLSHRVGFRAGPTGPEDANRLNGQNRCQH